MGLIIESGYTSINKAGEELCGDNVAVSKNGKYTTLVLADGLGSGVKANILSILTSKILCTMMANEISMEECIETIISTLPVCKVRGVAYSTFSAIHIDDDGKGYMFEFDNPAAIYFHDGKCMDFDRQLLEICEKKVYKTELNLSDGDYIIVMSDGVPHSGVGMLLNFGWQRNEIMQYLDREIKPDMSAKCVACMLTSACNDLYLDKPGDDTTVAAIKFREEITVDMMVGPPVDKDNDDFYLEKFMAGKGKKVVCGGTSSQIVARYLHEEIKTTLDFPDPEVPPIAYINGIDVTTEGVLTIRKLLKLSEEYMSNSDLTPKRYEKKDGASLLADMLFVKATHVNFFVGQSVNVAHQGLPIDTTMKLKLVEKLSKNLQLMGKTVEMNYD
ncbi:MAG: SpoIIE family protein phosphatase [Christensenellales bacterium]